MKIVNRKVVYLIIAIISLSIFSIWYVPRHTWRAISWDGYGDSDKGVGVGMTTWKSVYDGAIVDESVSTYRTPEDARKDFQKMLNDRRVTANRPINNEISSDNTERAVLRYGDSETGEGKIQIIKLKGEKIQSISAGSMKSALAFERDWLRIDF